VSFFAVALLAVAALLVVATEWPHLAGRVSPDVRRRRRRSRSKARLRVVQPPDSEEFARAVERDLAALPTTDEQDAKRR
jgi:hypothetical protein